MSLLGLQGSPRVGCKFVCTTQNQVGFPDSDFNLSLVLTYKLKNLRSRTSELMKFIFCLGLVPNMFQGKKRTFFSKIEVFLQYAFVDWKPLSTLHALLPEIFAIIIVIFYNRFLVTNILYVL